MTLKTDRFILQTDISFFDNDTSSAESSTSVVRGGIVSDNGPLASGAAMDQSQAICTYQANPSGVYPLGMLMTDVVNYDLTRQRQNPWREEVQTGMKVTIMRKGWGVTDWIYPGHTPVPGAKAYVGHSGYLATVNVATDNSDVNGVNKIVGQFLSAKDEDGFAKVEINLPGFNA